jgi:hypothetical protein
MAKRYKDIRDSYSDADDWGNSRREERIKDKQKKNRRKDKRQTKYKEKFGNFKEFRDYD